MTNINSAFYNYDETVEKSKTSYSGLLGLAINGNRIVNHPTRAGFVYVRLRDNLSEVVQAFNDKVSPVYDFPVLIQRKGNRWYVLGRDDLRYESWGTSAPYLPRHGDQHSFNREGGGGGDVTWVYPDQFMPLLVYPSGTYGASNLLVAPYVLQKSDKFIYVGNTGTANIVQYKPTNGDAIVGLVYLDRETGNPGFLINSGTPFAGTITGTNAIVPYLPYPSSTQEPLYAFRLVSGTTSLTWDNLYNVRQFIGGSTATGTSGGVSDHESLTGLLGGSANNHYHLTPSQVTGLVSGTNTTLHSHSGSSSSYNFVTGSIAFADTDGQLIEDNLRLRYDPTLRSVRMGKDIPLTNFADLFPYFYVAENVNESAVYGMYVYGSGTFGQPIPGFGMYRSRGTVELPTTVKKDDVLGSIFGMGHDGANFYGGGRVRFYADVDWTTGANRASRTTFAVVPSGTTTQIEKMVLYGDSLNLINTGTYNVDGSPHVHSLEDILADTSCKAVMNADANFSSSASFQIVAFDGADEFDTASMHSPSTNNSRITVPAAGKYQVIVAARFAANATGFRGVEVYKNGTTQINEIKYVTNTTNSATTTTNLNASGIIELAASDYLEMRILQNSGSTLALTQTGTAFTVIRLR